MSDRESMEFFEAYEAGKRDSAPATRFVSDAEAEALQKIMHDHTKGGPFGGPIPDLLATRAVLLEALTSVLAILHDEIGHAWLPREMESSNRADFNKIAPLLSRIRKGE